MGVTRARERLARGLVVANPAAGGAGGDVIDEVALRCGDRVRQLATIETPGPDAAVELVADAVRAARADGDPIELVVAVGGDGTVREVAEGLARGLGRWPAGAAAPGDAPTALFVAPAGSGNSAYAALWGERPWTEALDAVLDGGGHRVRDVDLVRIAEADRGALLGVNAGLVARIAELIEAKKAAARAAGAVPASPEADAAEAQQRYAAAIGEAIAELRLFPARVAVDGDPLHEGDTTLAVVGGVSSFGRGTFRLLPHSVIDDGVLDVCVVAGVTSEGLAELAPLVPAGEHLGRPGVEYARGRRVTIERTDGRPLTVEHDGDPRPAGSTLTLEVVSGAFPALAAPAG